MYNNENENVLLFSFSSHMSKRIEYNTLFLRNNNL